MIHIGHPVAAVDKADVESAAFVGARLGLDAAHHREIFGFDADERITITTAATATAARRGSRARLEHFSQNRMRVSIGVTPHLDDGLVVRLAHRGR